MHHDFENHSGLTTEQALLKLRDDIQEAVKQFEQQVQRHSIPDQKSWLKSAFTSGNYYHSLLCWRSAISIAIVALFLFVSAAGDAQNRQASPIIQAIVILVLLAANLIVVGWSSYLRHTELPRRLRSTCQRLTKFAEECSWKPENYPQLHSPQSPCITLQWTIRDGHLVNLPWSLLVAGDTIALQPGQVVPGQCKTNSEVLSRNSVYCPDRDASADPVWCNVPEGRKPRQCRLFTLLETPYVFNYLRPSLEQALQRPASVFNLEQHLLFTTLVESIFLPLAAVILLSAATAKWVWWKHWLAPAASEALFGPWFEVYFRHIASGLIPLLPLMLPIVSTVLDFIGLARVLVIFHSSQEIQAVLNPFEESETPPPVLPHSEPTWTQIYRYVLDVVLGRSTRYTLPYTANILHTLASVTALCCVDKKGILSWPNPTAEKVFFLKSKKPSTPSSRSSSGVFPSSDSSDEHERPMKRGKKRPESTGEDPEVEILLTKSHKRHRRNRKRRTRQGKFMPGTIVTAEVLDLTHDPASPFRLQFDDPGWGQHLSSLKPLGLNVLLNTCNSATQEGYNRFYSHVSCEAIGSDDLVPIANRRCLCELAAQIGFTDSAHELYSVEQQLCSFRHVHSDMVKSDRFTKSLPGGRLKLPFPHMVAVVVKDKQESLLSTLCSPSLHLLSQGTGDLVLDSCVDFWDGTRLRRLTDADRKKVLDFYHRNSLTAHCSAFAYRPLVGCSGFDDSLNQLYVELPADASHLYSPFRSPSPSPADTPLQYEHDGCYSNRLCYGQFHSADSLLYSVNKNNTDWDVVDDVGRCFQMQCNQVFIGMVTMQYQARIDMVQLIEQLERACVRFVHFSKENELRSRVFSEKMGLESGWNCHISLAKPHEGDEDADEDEDDIDEESDARQEDDDDSWKESLLKLFKPSTRCSVKMHSALLSSTSAPGHLNTDYTHVKFGDEVSLHRLSGGSDGPPTTKLPASISSSPSHHPLGKHTTSATMHRISGLLPTSSSSSSEESLVEAEGNREEGNGSVRHHQQGALSHSSSCVTESTEQSAPVTFDMSNRAKLPRGIDRIRPHLASVDNVPLLVSLFTDCTPEATREMVAIMQEYGEVVCVIGSSANSSNAGIFLQANASLAVEPLYPQVCQHVAVCTPLTPSVPTSKSPVEVGQMLGSLPCSLAFVRDERISLFHLIMESRHYLQSVRSCFQLWLCSCLSLCFIQLLSSCILLPPPLSSADALWLSAVCVPCISVSVALGTPVDSHIMMQATGTKNRPQQRARITHEIILFVVWCYGSKFVPSLLICMTCFGLMLHSYCNNVISSSDATDVHCAFVYPVDSSGSYAHGWISTDSLQTAQQFISILLVLYFVFISSTFIHRRHHIWQKSPFQNRIWLVSCSVILVLQLIFSSLFVSINALSQIPSTVWILSVIWLPILIALNELVKRREITVNVRYQKRARLEFGTKLGMNSPF